jgi:hypothetical protein
MEIPFLSWSSILGLDDEISSSEVVNVSALSKSGNNMEIGIDFEAPISIPLSLGWFTLPVFSVDEIPSLRYFNTIDLI